MKYSLDFYIICDDTQTQNEIKKVFPNKDDYGVWSVEYQYPTEYINSNNNRAIKGAVCFIDRIDRDNMEETISQIQGMFVLCEVGSWMRLHICNHDGDTGGNCEEEIIYEVIV